MSDQDKKDVLTLGDFDKTTTINSQLPRFVVPIYQRIFTWGDEQICRLLRDLYEHFNEKSTDYYLGIITVVKSNDDLILVDGQQRLTCMMLLGKLLELNLDYTRLYYDAREQDNQALTMIYGMNGIDVNNFPQSSNVAMNAFFKYAAEMGKEVGKLKEEKDKIKGHVKVLVSYLPEDPYSNNIEQQNLYFEKMNSGGRQLEPHEILKVRICSKCNLANVEELRGKNPFEVWNEVVNFAKKYGEKDSEQEKGNSEKMAPAKFVDLISCENHSVTIGKEPTEYSEPDNPVRQGLIPVPMFLLHVLQLTTKAIELRADKILEQFEKVKEDFDVNKFLDEMVKYRKFIDDEIIHLSNDTNTAAYSYQFYSDETSSKDDDKQDMVALKQFQSMLFVADGGRSGSQKWLLKAYETYKNNKAQWKKSPLDSLKNNDKVSLESLIGNKDQLNALSYNDKPRWLLWRLDYLLWEEVTSNDGGTLCLERDKHDFAFEGQEKSLIKSFRFHTGRSIEHLHPQNDGGGGDWNKTRYYNKDFIEQHPKEGDDTCEMKQFTSKDFIGNLCLITPSLNSTLSDDSVGVKLAKIRDLKTNLQSIKMLLMYKECGGNDSQWTPEAANQHWKRMMSVIEKSYLYKQIEGEQPNE